MGDGEDISDEGTKGRKSGEVRKQESAKVVRWQRREVRNQRTRWKEASVQKPAETSNSWTKGIRDEKDEVPEITERLKI